MYIKKMGLGNGGGDTEGPGFGERLSDDWTDGCVSREPPWIQDRGTLTLGPGSHRSRDGASASLSRGKVAPEPTLTLCLSISPQARSTK